MPTGFSRGANKSASQPHVCVCECVYLARYRIHEVLIGRSCAVEREARNWNDEAEAG